MDNTPILDKLNDAYVFYIDDDWTFWEFCDEYYHLKLSKEDIIQLSEELKIIAENIK